jgi:DNA-binding NarL/FixJ family response regulator
LNIVKTITVLLAEDHLIVREGLCALLAKDPGIEVIAEADDGRQTVDLVRKIKPDVVILDIAMPLLNGLEAARQIRKFSPATKLIILSAHSDDAYIEHVMALGASGYLNKQTGVEMLSKAIHEVMRGGTFFSPTIAKRIVQKGQRKVGKTAEPARLTSRESEVLQLIAEGKANKETAHELKISIKTVEKHRQSLMNKLNIHDTAGLTRHAIAAGVIESTAQITTEPAESTGSFARPLVKPPRRPGEQRD